MEWIIRSTDGTVNPFHFGHLGGLSVLPVERIIKPWTEKFCRKSTFGNSEASLTKRWLYKKWQFITANVYFRSSVWGLAHCLPQPETCYGDVLWYKQVQQSQPQYGWSPPRWWWWWWWPPSCPPASCPAEPACSLAKPFLIWQVHWALTFDPTLIFLLQHHLSQKIAFGFEVCVDLKLMTFLMFLSWPS